MSEEVVLRYGFLWPDTQALGPGHRFALWLQGCGRRCYRCATPELQPLEGGHQCCTEQLAAEICETPQVTGLTISGGEPLLQAPALALMLAQVRERRPDMDVILFTGYLMEDLQSVQAKALLNYIDLLIDGEYYDELNDNRGLRGSSNQRLHFVTDRLLPWKDELLHSPRNREMHLLGDHDLLTIGIAPKL
jgi:anaerobic ribonucleoside-triphosphate reductase activating protein